MTIRTRFAPSPTGYMHIGGLRTALYTYLIAKKEGGTFILRIEDTDTKREVQGAVERILEVFQATGLQYDEGPDVGGDYGPYIQTQRKPLYKQYADILVEKGAAYPCFCSKERLDTLRAEYETRGETFKYDKHCLCLSKEEAATRIAAGESYVIRQEIPPEGSVSFEDVLYGTITVDLKELDDQILLKSDGLPTYNFANVVDDHLMKITHVVRGTEYLSSSPKYNLLYEAFGWEIPQYIHLAPIMRDARHKLSKRDGDPTYEDLLEKGYLREAIINYIVLLGWSPGNDREFFTLAELVEEFSIRGLSKSPALFDIAKLTWFNWEYTRNLPESTYDELALPWLAPVLPPDRWELPRLCRLLQSRTEKFSDLPQMVSFLASMPDYDLDIFTHKKMKTDLTIARAAIEGALPVLTALTEWTEPALHDALMSLPEKLGMKNGQVLWPVRIAVTGLASTPGGAIELCYLLGRDETLARMRHSLSRLPA